VYKKNKNIKAQNNKASKRTDTTDAKKKHMCLLDAPENLNQPAELFPEAVAFLFFKEHPMFIRDAQVNTQATSTAGSKETPSPLADNDNSQLSSEDAEDTTFRNRMTTKGYFKSRNTLRAEELERKKKQKKVSNSTTTEIVDLTSSAVHNDIRRTEAATQHAEAATLQAISGMYKSQLDALQRAQDMGISTDDLRPFILTTLTNLYSSSGKALKKLGHGTVNTNDDPDVTFVEIRNSLGGKLSAVDAAEEEYESYGECAAGDCCLEPSVEIRTDDKRCDVCNRIAHSYCIATDDVRSACLKCFGEDEV
jgi:hypothetical protein